MRGIPLQHTSSSINVLCLRHRAKVIATADTWPIKLNQACVQVRHVWLKMFRSSAHHHPSREQFLATAEDIFTTSGMKHSRFTVHELVSVYASRDLDQCKCLSAFQRKKVKLEMVWHLLKVTHKVTHNGGFPPLNSFLEHVIAWHTRINSHPCL